jgi:hypothetical protein
MEENKEISTFSKGSKIFGILIIVISIIFIYISYKMEDSKNTETISNYENVVNSEISTLESSATQEETQIVGVQNSTPIKDDKFNF